MGDPKKRRKNFAKPAIIWQKERIEEEKKLIQKFGLKNKREIWKFSSMMKRYTAGAKKLISQKSKQSDVEKVQLLKKLSKYGLIESNSRIEDVLNLNIENFLDRRLQTLLVKLGHARTMRQSRQFIVHQHVKVLDKAITSPSYLVAIEEEKNITFNANSTLADPEHPERAIPDKNQKIEEPVEVKE